MGWASWNSFAAKINYNVIKAQADAAVASGLKEAGYQYVNIDEGCGQGTRDGDGNIVVSTTHCPGGRAADGRKPDSALCAPSLQRGYGRGAHDVAIQSLPVR